MININIDHKHFLKNNNSLIAKQNFMAKEVSTHSPNQKSKQLYSTQSSVISAFVLGLICLILPPVKGTNKQVVTKLLTRNFPLAILGALSGGYIGGKLGKRQYEKYNAMLQNIANAETNQNKNK